MADDADDTLDLIVETMSPIVAKLQQEIVEAQQREDASADRLRTLQDRALRLEDRLALSDGDYEAKGKRETVVELWPEEGENKDRFMERCVGKLTKCIGEGKAVRVCRTKWRKSETAGKKAADKVAFIARGLDADDTVEACGKSCLACEGRDAPFDPDRET